MSQGYNKNAEKQRFRDMVIPEDDIEWLLEKNKKFPYHATVIHKPTGIRVEQAGERTWADPKAACLEELKFRLFEQRKEV